ncbi:MAG: SDR family oxidoreductase [Chlorobiaceae bacterium]|nr:SDR family oxidoreductase [Chlorobiaceae bacterium]NTW10799.1 SDR family oxidoreductase [Chlorobiaceae bacterium]
MAGYWTDKNALVTGAASGIGFALSKELAARGANVWLTDIDTAALERAREELGPNPSLHELDVRDSSAVRDLVEGIVKQSGSLDFMFNNAGIIMPGEVHDLDAEHFDRIIDVNIRGVVNGTIAAYPVMVRQRGGHIVNTASLAGLAPAPLLSSYAMTKHAVVGFSTSLRFEAARYGVRVSAICPSAVDTPMLDAGTPSDLQKVSWRPNVRRYLRRLNGPPADPGKVASEALSGVEKNRALIIVPARAGLIAMVYRLTPGVVHSLGRLVVAAELNGRPPLVPR